MEIYDRGWRLKALRKKRGLSQKAVADRLGVDRAAIVRMSETSPRPALTFWRIWRCSTGPPLTISWAWSTVPPSTLMISRKVSRKRYAASSKPCGGNS